MRLKGAFNNFTTLFLLTKYLCLPVLSYCVGCRRQFADITNKLDVCIFAGRWELRRQICWNFACGGELLVTGRVCITLQIEKLPLVREDILVPEAGCKGMRRCLVDDRDIGTGQ